MPDATLRRFARDQWVRLHGTPRVTVLVGGEAARRMWLEWLAVAGLEGQLLEGGFDTAVRDAVMRAVAQPHVPIAVLTSAAELRTWRAHRHDRIAAMVDEGMVEIRGRIAAGGGGGGAAAGAAANGAAEAAGAPGKRRARGSRPPVRAGALFDARSAAEAALYEALEATPATRGRFALNANLPVRFGPSAAEVDLLARQERIAIELDGYHHFTDVEAYRRDRDKDLLLQTQGLLVLRVLAEDVLRDPRPAVAMVCRALAHRLEEPR